MNSWFQPGLARGIVNFCRRYLHVDRAQCEGPLSIAHKMEEDAEARGASCVCACLMIYYVFNIF